jgi:SAM-dependent methyltransferase
MSGPARMNSEYVQYGCGWCAPESWLNFDCSPTLRFERLPLAGRLYTRNARRFPGNVRFGDIVRGLPVAPGSCRGIYCSHVLEHLALDDFHAALRNTYTYLRPGGVFRLVVPDLERLARDYLADPSPTAAEKFMDESVLGRKRRPRGFRGLLGAWLGNSAHLWMWDEKAMRARLAEHGFKDLRRAALGDAEDRMFDLVEDKGRFDGCLAIQCRR